MIQADQVLEMRNIDVSTEWFCGVSLLLCEDGYGAAVWIFQLI
jgi:hypothetical protein